MGSILRGNNEWWGTRVDISRHTSGIFQSPTTFMHLVLLRYTPRHEMDHAWSITLHLKLTGSESPLLSNENMKVIVCSVNASVSFGSKRCTEDNKVFCNARVDNVHRTHGTSSIIKHPVFMGVKAYFVIRVCFCEIRDNMRDHPGGVVR